MRKFDLKAGDYIKYGYNRIQDQTPHEDKVSYYRVIDVTPPKVFVCLDGWGKTTSFQKKQYTVIGEISKTTADMYFRHTTRAMLKKWAEEEAEIDKGMVGPK